MELPALSDCIEYGGFIAPNGYGKSGHVYAHRRAYEEAYGPIPEGLDIDHLCRNRKCVNPKHLEAVTRRENLLRGETLPAKQVLQSHCKRGHPLSGGNLLTAQLRYGKRACRECHNARRRHPS